MEYLIIAGLLLVIAITVLMIVMHISYIAWYRGNQQHEIEIQKMLLKRFEEKEKQS